MIVESIYTIHIWLPRFALGEVMRIIDVDYIICEPRRFLEDFS